jgi:hypothetical protein
MNAMTMVAVADQNEMRILLARFDAEKQKLIKAVGADGVVWDVVDLDLGGVLAQLLPALLAMLKGGSPIGIVLLVVEFALSQVFKDSTLIDIVKQIITLILKPLS